MDHTTNQADVKFSTDRPQGERPDLTPELRAKYVTDTIAGMYYRDDAKIQNLIFEQIKNAIASDRKSCIAELVARERVANFNLRAHEDDLLHVRRELDGYARGLNDAVSVIRARSALNQEERG